MRRRQSCYAVHIVGCEPIVAETWEKAKTLTSGVPNSYTKKFEDRGACDEYIRKYKDGTQGDDALSSPQMNNSTCRCDDCANMRGEDKEEDVAYTDGSVANGRGAYGIFFSENDKRNRAAIMPPAFLPDTVPQVEVKGIIEGAKLIARGGPIFTDSAYAHNASTNPHARKWVSNAELIEELQEVLREKKVSVRKVKSHSNCHGNDAADRLCREAINRHFAPTD